VHDQTLLAHILKSDAPLIRRSPQRRNCTGSRRRSGRYQPLAAPPTRHMYTTTPTTRVHRPLFSPKAAPSARTTKPPAPPWPSQRSGFSPGRQGEEGKTKHDGEPKEVGGAKRHRSRLDRPPGLGFLSVVDPIKNTSARSRAGSTSHRPCGVGCIWERKGLALQI
jgi:hypothetical protein